MREKIFELVFMSGVFCVLGLGAYGAYAAWNDARAPDDHCYWLANDVAGRPPCLLDTPPRGSCVKMDFVYAHQAMCAPIDRLGDFAQKAGRRICGQATQICASVMQ